MILTSEMTLAEKVQAILTTFGLDFTILKLPMVAIKKIDENTTQDIVSDYFGLVNDKTNEVIHTVKGGYTVSQNKDIIELVLRGIESFGEKLKVTKAGALNGGKKVFVQLEVANDKHVNGDKITQFITIIDSNDGSTGLAVGIGDITMSCSNQFTKFYKNSDARFRHTATIEQKMKTIPTLIERCLTLADSQVEIYNELAQVAVTEQNVHEIVRAVLGYDRKLTPMEIMATKSTKSINIMEELYAHIAQEMAGKGMNLWGLHSGVTSYTTHAKRHPKRENGDMESLLIGGSYEMNQKSFNYVTGILDAVLRSK